VVIHDLNVVRISISPHEAKPPLVIDPDAVLALPVTTQSFQTVAGRCCQIAELGSAVQLAELSSGNLLNRLKATALPAMMQPFSVRAAERLDHAFIIFCLAFNVQQKSLTGRSVNLANRQGAIICGYIHLSAHIRSRHVYSHRTGHSDTH
jgi:hypothetical protein